MSSTASKAKWIGILLLHLPLYLVTSYVMRSLLGSGFRLLIKAGANLAPNLLLQHFLVVGLICGFLAGLMGIVTVRAMLLLPIGVPALNGPAWKRPQVWTWTISSCWFVFGIWAMAGARPSVLAAPSGWWFSDVIKVIFGRGCDLSIDLSVFQGCMTQLSFTLPWMGTIGYSAAVLIPAEWISRLHNSVNGTEGLEASNERRQSGPGEVLN
ncbi:MAG TPA: hypothetical protein VFW25_10260 [Silvibacterium sp.]|nr:hypothetical protein [Silvibacterium sp.]